LLWFRFQSSRPSASCASPYASCSKLNRDPSPRSAVVVVVVLEGRNALIASKGDSKGKVLEEEGGTCSIKVGEEVLEEGRKVVLPCEMSKRAKGEHLMGESKRLKQKLARS